MIVADIALVVIGVAVIAVVVDAAVRTFVLPRGSAVLLTRVFFRVCRSGFDFVAAHGRSSYERRDRIMALYAPFTLTAMPVMWLSFIWLGFGCLFYVSDGEGWDDAFTTSGSSLLTLGFERPPSGMSTWLSFGAAAIGLTMIAVLIAYLPQIYAAFSRREVSVSKLSSRAGTPPDPVMLLERAYRGTYLDELDDLWSEWETWFSGLAETHTSLAMLSFFRSPGPERSWITASGVVLDAASLRYAIVDVAWTPAAGLCIRSGYLALREIAGHFGIEYDPDPAPDDPISVTRDEFEVACDQLVAAGVPVRSDLDQAWRDYAGWRVNYDHVLVSLSAFMAAPYARWSSDRSVTGDGSRCARSATCSHAPLAAQGAVPGAAPSGHKEVSIPSGLASARMNHSVPMTSANTSSAIARKK